MKDSIYLRKKKYLLINWTLENYESVSKEILNYDPNIIIHLQCIYANKSNVDPFNSFDNSLRTLENVLTHRKI